MSGQVVCVVLRLNLDCNACCRKMKRVLLRMKEIEMFLIEKEYNRVSVCGRYDPAEAAIKIRRKMKRRVEILEVEEIMSHPNGQEEQMSHVHDNAIIQHA